MTTLAAPKKAKKAFENGVKHMRKAPPDPQKAAKELEKAVGEYPQYAAAWTALGDVRAATNDLEGALEAYTKAREADPKYLRPYLSLARISMQSSQWAQTAELCDAALRLNPHLTELRYYHAVASFYEGEFEDAEKSAAAIQSGEQAQKFPQTHQLLGMIHAKQGNYSKAASEYRSFLSMQPAGPAAEDLKRQLTEWVALGVIAETQTP